MKIRRKKLPVAVFALPMLAVYGLLNGFILLNLSQAHLHWAGGLLIAHWHPNATSTGSNDEPGKPPLGKHTHPLGDISNLLHPVNGQYLSNIIHPEVILPDTTQTDPPIVIITYKSQIYLVANSSRSPPSRTA
jgi:hypothetical protein